MKFISAALLCTVLLFTSCSKDDVVLNESAKTILNVSYGTDPLQGMDIYLPPGRHQDSTKVLIMIHGGGWSAGDKADFTQYVDTMKRRLPHYAVVNINYRLATPGFNLFPTQENDVKAAIYFIYSKRSEYHISDKFILLGASAGGHLALLQGYKYSLPVRIKAIVDFFGPTDMSEMYYNPASIFAPPTSIAAVMGGTPTSNPLIYQQSSPINFITAQSPPTIILQGGVDQLVAPSQSASLNAALQSMGVPHQYVFYPTENHGWTGANLVDSFDKIQAFLAAYVH
jgi:acetyl esterase/lipase